MRHLLLRLFIISHISFGGTMALAQYRSQVWSPDNGDGTYTNPVINADYSDLDIVCVGEDYYLTASSFNQMPGLPILHSKDLVNWEIIGHALQEQNPDSLRPKHGDGVYAPSIRYHKGMFYIYWGDPDIGCLMIKACDPRGPWSEPILVFKGKGVIDTCPLWEDDGEDQSSDGHCYLANAWANSGARFNNLLTIRELSADGTRAISDPVIVFDGNAHNMVTVEGPKLYKRDGWYWIMCPTGGIGTGPQLAMRSKSIYGPYEHKEVLKPVKNGIQGPHQGGWVHTAFGEDWFMHFEDRGVYGRVAHLQPVDWSSGWPIMGKKTVPVTKYRKPKSNSTIVMNPQESDEFNSTYLGPQWQWETDYQEKFGMATNSGVFRLYSLILPGQEKETNLWNVPNLLLQKTPNESFTATAKVKMVSLNEHQRGGIVSFGRNYSALVIEREGDDMFLRQVSCEHADRPGKKETVTNLVRLKPDNTQKYSLRYPAKIEQELFLRMMIDNGKGRFAYSEDGKVFHEVGSEFTLAKVKYIGTKVGLTCTEANEKGRRGWLDIDWFRISK